MNEKKVKAFKLVTLIASIVVVGFLIISIINIVKDIQPLLRTIRLFKPYSGTEVENTVIDLKRSVTKGCLYLGACTLSALLILTFNYFLWFKDVFEFVSPEKIAERKAAKAAAKKQRLEEKLKNL